jgi:two-component system, NarL family, response regulator NreC
MLGAGATAMSVTQNDGLTLPRVRPANDTRTLAAAMPTKHRIVIAEDHTILREGLRAMFASDPQLEVVGEIDNGRDAVRAVSTLKPDLVLMDLSMPGMDGLAAIREIRKRESATRILALTVHKTEEYIRSALEAGASGYVLKDATRNELLTAIRAVLAGKTYISPAVSERIIGSYLDGTKVTSVRPASEGLTERERQVLKLIAEGRRNKDIAQYLSISVKTVEKHRANLMHKLNLHTASALTAFAIENGIVEL